MNLRTRIRAEIEQETRTGKHRDRYVPTVGVHPYQFDLDRLIEFVIDRRARQPGALDAVRRLCRRVDVEALRFLIAVVLEQGRCDLATRRRCARVSEHCRTIESAVLLLKRARRHCS